MTPTAHRLRRLAAATFVALAFLAAGTLQWGFLTAEELAHRPDNIRRIEADRRIRRGPIVDRRGRVLAETRFVDGVPDRVYPVPAAAPVVGYQTWRYGAGVLGRTYGAGGAEAAYDAALRGDVAMGPGEVLASRLLHRPQQGLAVTLTLDAALQTRTVELLGGREGSIVVVEVGSGAIRALASSPTFDPAALDEGDIPTDDPAAVMLNRATQGLYPPGSTWKTVTLAAAIHAGLVDPDTMTSDGDTVEYFEGFPVGCNNNPPGRVNFDIAHAYGWSCNVTFARLGTELGEPLYKDYAEGFGAGAAPPFPLPVASSQLTSGPVMSLPELASAAFGQGELLMTPLHMALVAAAMAGDGALPKPALLEGVEGAGERAVREERGPWRQPVSPGTALTVRRIMVTSVNEGWAGTATAGTGITAGGKTGTAEVGEGQPHAWFIGFAPAIDPTYAVAVLVVNGGEGSTVAAPIGGLVLQEALRLDAEYRLTDQPEGGVAP